VKRHPADLISLIAGLIFVLIGLAYLFSENLDVNTGGTRWLLPVALIGLGIAGLAGSLAGARRSRNGTGADEELLSTDRTVSTDQTVPTDQTVSTARTVSTDRSDEGESS
jgi:hypothetical protein